MEENKFEEKRRQGAEMVIRNHVMWSMGAGFIPVPIADFFAVSAVQLDMVRQLCRLYDIDFKETEGKAIITTLTGSTLARIGAKAVVKLIPGVGSVIGGVTLAIFSGASTYALGEVFKRHFETGGTFLDFDPARLKKFYDEKFEKGKKVAQDLQKEQETKRTEAAAATTTPEAAAQKDVKTETEILVEKLKTLADLKAQGVLTEEEFAQMKAKLIEAF